MAMRNHVKSLTQSSWLSASLMLGSLVLVIGVLYLARAILIPIAVAILLTFILAPIVTALRRHGLGRTWSVILTVTLAFVFLGGIAGVIGHQLRSLANDLPAYRHNIRQKISDLRLARQGVSLEKVQQTVKGVIQEVNQEPSAVGTNTPALPVVVTKQESVESALAWVGPLIEPLGNAGLVIVLVIFMSLRREDLRDRLLRLAGYGRLVTTTKAIDEAGKRVSKYLLRQFLVNSGYGALLGLGFFFIGLPYAILWGVLAAVTRFIPYVGPLLGAAGPILMSLAVFDSWTAPLMVVGLVALLEVINNVLIEPRVYGHSIGVSEIALLIMIAFWTWLWGPIGMVLAAPLTVCLVVISNSVPDLEFIGLLLSREPALAPHHVFYQRLVAKDADEAQEIVERYLGEHKRIELYENLFMPALAACRHDRRRQRLTDQDQQFAYQLVRQIIEETGGNVLKTSEQSPGPKVARLVNPEASERPLLLGYPAYDDADELALLMLAGLLYEEGWTMHVLSSSMLVSEAIPELEKRHPAAVCIGSVSGGSLFGARQFCKRVHEQQPNLCIVLGRWLAHDGQEEIRRRFAECITEFGSSLNETKNQLTQLAQTKGAGEPASTHGPSYAGASLAATE
jgi:predicted PurR-regulated permease PerM